MTTSPCTSTAELLAAIIVQQQDPGQPPPPPQKKKNAFEGIPGSPVLGLCTFPAEGQGLIPRRGTKIPHAV